jgi:hypothetical protein
MIVDTFIDAGWTRYEFTTEDEICNLLHYKFGFNAVYIMNDIKVVSAKDLQHFYYGVPDINNPNVTWDIRIIEEKKHIWQPGIVAANYHIIYMDKMHIRPIVC